jgi:hypothetical protein
MIYPRPHLEVEGGCFVCGILSRCRKRVGGYDTKNRRQINHEGVDWKASRLAYHLNVSPLPPTPETLREGIVCHTCDNAWCTNPAHLYLGTAKQNTKDIFDRNKLIRGRMSEARKGNQNAKGNKLSEEVKALMSQQRIGNQHAKGNKYKLTPEQCANRKWTFARRMAHAEKMKGNSFRQKHLEKQDV